MRVRLYQIREDCAPHLLFRDREAFRSRYGERVPAEVYRKVFDGDLNVNGLEEVFSMFNVNHPEGYTGRSMSVSDVVELTEEGTFYFCDSFGFDRVLFSTEEQENGQQI